MAVSYVQFQLLARLGDSPTGSHEMTDLADGVVYSRSGLTYQAGLLEKAGLVTRGPSPDDERSVTVTITDAGRAVLGKVFPGHAEVIKELLFAPLSSEGTAALATLLGPVRDHMRSIPPRSAAPPANTASPPPRRPRNLDPAQNRLRPDAGGNEMRSEADQLGVLARWPVPPPAPRPGRPDRPSARPGRRG